MSQKMDNLLHAKNAPNGTAPVKETRTKKILGLRFLCSRTLRKKSIRVTDQC